MPDAQDPETSDKNKNPDSSGAPSEAPTENRRDFLKKATLGLAATAGASAALPILSPILTPLQVDGVWLKGTELDAGPVTAFSSTPTKVPVALTCKDAWTQTEKVVVGAVYVRREGETLSAFSSICPHASCAVSFDTEGSQYVCPCHNTYFKITGELAEGPSQRGLDSLPVRVKDGRVFVTYKSFKPGSATKEEV